MNATKMVDHMGFAIDDVGPKMRLAPLSKSATTGLATPKTFLDKKGNIIPRKFYNNLRHEWTDTPPPSIRIASDAEGNPLTFAEKPLPREPERPKMMTAADIARAHGRDTLRRIRGV